jgi:hypothetical protein
MRANAEAVAAVIGKPAGHRSIHGGLVRRLRRTVHDGVNANPSATAINRSGVDPSSSSPFRGRRRSPERGCEASADDRNGQR